MNGEHEFYISIDVEADGPIPGWNSMLQLGAAAFDGLSEEPLGTFSVNLDLLPGATQDPDTMTWWGTNEKAYSKTREGTRKPEAAMRDFVNWVNQISCKQDKKPVLIGYPVTYDFMYVYWYTMRFVGISPFGFQDLDIKTLGSALLNCDFREASKSKYPHLWMNGLHLHPEHDALRDAIEQGILFTRMIRALPIPSPYHSHSA